jgi:membrane-associated phospholipid phosphatase
MTATVLAVLVLAGVWAAVQGGHTASADHFGFRLLALPTRGWAADAAPTGVDVAKVILGLAVAVALAWLAVRNRAWGETAALLLGLVLAQLTAHIFKNDAARPRPSHELVAAGGFPFPSTTSATGASFLFLGIALARPLTGRARRAVIAAGAALTLVLALSFVALRVHYLSDVVAGLALGVLAFALCEALVEQAASLLRGESH